MIEVNVQKDSISVTGHAGYAPPGQDIVCAAVSTLIQTLAASLDSLTDDNPDYTIAPGVFVLETKDLSAKAKLLVDSFFLGINGTIAAHPDYVRIV